MKPAREPASSRPKPCASVEWGPLPGLPTGVMESIWALDGTHTGAVVLYDGFDEQARHEHMSDEYKDRYIIRTLLMTLPSVLQTI